MSHVRRSEMVEPDHSRLSITRQCELLRISRSSWYYEEMGESPLNLALMRIIDEEFLEDPSSGARQMARILRRKGYCVNRKRVRRLMQKMGLMAIYQKPRTSEPHPEHKIYPYLLRDLEITAPNRKPSIPTLPLLRGGVRRGFGNPIKTSPPPPW